MKQYLDLLRNIYENGREKESGRINMPNVKGISNAVIRMDLQKGFPLLTTKKMFWKGIIHELLWFLRGDTNIKYLVDNNVNIWTDNAYVWFKKLNNNAYKKAFKINIDNISENDIENYINRIAMAIKKTTIDEQAESEMSLDSFISEVKKGHKISDLNYTFGDLGKVYGYQWRNRNGVDQVKNVLDLLKNNPYSRYMIIDSWNASDFEEMALPPCHVLYQFIVRPLTLKERMKYYDDNKGEFFLFNDDNELIKRLDATNTPKFYLDLNMYQRSCDTFLGVPFNIASMSLLLMLFAKASNMLPGISTWIGGDVHYYLDHEPMVLMQLEREPYDLPQLIIKKEINNLEDILNLTIDDFNLINYKSHGIIKAELFTGLDFISKK